MATLKSKIPLRFFVSRNIVHACLEITVVSKASGMDSFDFVGAPLTLQSIEEGVYPPPTMKVSLEDAQTLMDELWNCNVRPSDGTGNLGQVGAMQTNLVAFVPSLSRHGTSSNLYSRW